MADQDDLLLTSDDLAYDCDQPQPPTGYVPPAGAGFLLTEPRTQPDVVPQSYFYDYASFLGLVSPITKDRRPAETDKGVVPNQLFVFSPQGNTNRVALYAWSVGSQKWYLLFDSTTDASSSKPTLTLTLSASAIQAGGTVSVNAHPSSTTALISRVDFYRGTQLLGTATTDPYAVDYTPQVPGTDILTAKVTDSAGQTATADVTLTVTATAVNLPPVATITASATTIPLGQSVTVSGTAMDPDGSVASGQFFVGSTPLGNMLASAPFAATDTPATTGQFIYIFKVVDDKNAYTTAQVTVSVVAPIASGKPGNLAIRADAGANRQITLTSVFPVADNGSPIYGYNVYAAGTNTVLLANIAFPTIYTAPADGTYSFEATALNNNGEGPRSPVAGPVTITTTPGTVSSTKSYTTTADDYQAKFGQAYVGTYVGVTRSGTASAATQTAADTQALANARTAAIAAMTQQTFSSTQSYTTTPADFSTKCGSGTSGTAVTKSATKSGYSTQPAADAAALAQAQQDAIAAIVCPVAPPTFASTLNPGDNVDTATFDSGSQGQLLYNGSFQAQATVPGASTAAFYYPDLNTPVGALFFDPADAGKVVAYKLGGAIYYKNAGSGAGLALTDGSILLGN